jgi:hypothetical protein
LIKTYTTHGASITKTYRPVRRVPNATRYLNTGIGNCKTALKGAPSGKEKPRQMNGGAKDQGVTCKAIYKRPNNNNAPNRADKACLII